MAAKKKSDDIERLPSGVPVAPKGMETKVRLRHLLELKRLGRPLVMVTAYDTCFARLADDSGIDVILVGDSLGNVMHGFDTTLPVTMDMMVMHTAAVTRGARRASCGPPDRSCSARRATLRRATASLSTRGAS